MGAHHVQRTTDATEPKRCRKAMDAASCCGLMHYFGGEECRKKGVRDPSSNRTPHFTGGELLYPNRVLQPRLYDV